MIKTCGFHVFTNIFGMKCPFSALHCVPQELHSQDFLGGKLLYYCDFACADHGGTTRSEKTEFAQQPLVVVTWTVQRVHQTAVEDPALHLAWGGTVGKDALISSWCTKLNFLNPFLSKTALLSPISIQSHLLQCGIDFLDLNLIWPNSQLYLFFRLRAPLVFDISFNDVKNSASILWDLGLIADSHGRWAWPLLPLAHLPLKMLVW